MSAPAVAPSPRGFQITAHEPKEQDSLAWVIGGVIASAVVHLVLFLWLGSRPQEKVVPKPKPVTMEVVSKPKPPPPPKVEPPKPEEPKPLPKVEPPKPVKVTKAPPPPPPPPSNQPPPPPSNEPPPPIQIGLSLSSTAKGGDFVAPVGNTLSGDASGKAADPNAAKAYAAPPGPARPVETGQRFVPSYKVSEPPKLVGDFKPPYPEEARREGLEGQVTLQLTIDGNGKVTKARVVQKAGNGFDEAAIEGARKLRFSPATLDGEPVTTEITYVMTFLLD